MQVHFSLDVCQLPGANTNGHTLPVVAVRFPALYLEKCIGVCMIVYHQQNPRDRQLKRLGLLASVLTRVTPLQTSSWNSHVHPLKG